MKPRQAILVAGVEMRTITFPFVLAALGLAFGARSHGQLGNDFVLDPRTVVSPSGEFALHVDPSRRDGSGPATYRFTRGDAEVWAGWRPWTLWDAVVSDDGLVAGCAYAAGYGGGAGDALTVVLLDASGKVRLEERSERTGDFSDIGAPSLTARALVIDPDDDRLAVCTFGDWGSVESWWTYALTTGAPGPHLAPRDWLPPDQRLLRIAEARAVPGTGLTLLCWDWMDDQAHQAGPVFTLHEADGTLRWRLDWPVDRWVDDFAARWQLHDEATKYGVIVGTRGPGRFTLRRMATDEAVTFEVVRGSDAADVQVREVGRARFEPPTLPVRDWFSELRAPLEVESLGTVVPDGAAGETGRHDGPPAPALRPGERRIAQPGTDRAWILGLHTLDLVDAQGRTVSRVERASDGAWLRTFGYSAVGPDGSLALTESDFPMGTSLESLLVFDPNGAPLRALELPLNATGPIAFDGHRVACSRTDPATRLRHLVLLDLEEHTCTRLSVEPTAGWPALAFAADGHELWALDGAQSVQRYRLD